MASSTAMYNVTGPSIEAAGSSCRKLDFSVEHRVGLDVRQFSITTTTGILTICGNLLSICIISNIIMRKRDSRNASTMYLLALATSDFLQAIFVYPLHIFAQALGYWAGGLPACITMAYFGNFFYILSALIVTTLAAVRFFATWNPLAFRHYLQRNTLWGSILVTIIVFAAVISALPFTSLGCIAFHASGAICSYDWYAQGLASFSTVAILLSQSIMLVVIVVCTVGTIICLRNQSRRHDGELRRMERNFSLGVVAIATVQIICWGPFVIWQSVSLASGQIVPMASLIVGYLTFFVSVFNPVVFACMMKPYRADCCRLLRLVFCCRKTPDDGGSSDSDSSKNRRTSNSTSLGKSIVPAKTMNIGGGGSAGEKYSLIHVTTHEDNTTTDNTTANNTTTDNTTANNTTANNRTTDNSTV